MKRLTYQVNEYWYMGSMFAKSVMQKNKMAEWIEIGLYPNLALSIFCSVSYINIVWILDNRTAILLITVVLNVFREKGINKLFLSELKFSDIFSSVQHCVPISWILVLWNRKLFVSFAVFSDISQNLQNISERNQLCSKFYQHFS